MKAVILAAGKGVRMLPLTETTPKVMVEVAGKPFLEYVLHNLTQSGYTEIGIVAGYLKEKIVDYVRRYPQIIVLEQREQLGTGHALLQAREFCGQDEFIVLGGDNLFGVEDLQRMRQITGCGLCAKEVEDPRKYGVLVTNDGYLNRIVEKPINPIGNNINVGLYKFTASVWDALERIPLSLRGEYELTDALTLLAKTEMVRVLPLNQHWLDLGCVDDLPHLSRTIRKIYSGR